MLLITYFTTDRVLLSTFVLSVGSMERRKWECSGITESIRIADSNMSEILPNSAKYSKKARWGWYINQASETGGNLCWQTSVRYLESG